MKFKNNISLIDKVILSKPAIFIHIPKTAGISIFMSLYGIKGGHSSISRWEEKIGKRKLEKYFKFTVIREPTERFISAYNFLLNGGLGSENEIRMKNILKRNKESLDEFIWNLYENKDTLPSQHFASQYSYLTNKEGDVAVDKIIKYEDIDAEIRKIAKKYFEIEKFLFYKFNSTSETDKWLTRKMLTTKQINKLKEIYQHDFKLHEKIN